jgi:hypothetical protein
MGNQLSLVANKIGDYPTKCLEVNIAIRRGTPERFFLVPLTLSTMPTPQSPLCEMLNEALSAPSAVHWAWPPVSNVETASSGVADDRLAFATEGSRAVPTAEQTFLHALPSQVTGRQHKVEGHPGAVELGHLLSFVAVKCPVDCPGRGHPPRHQRDRAAPQGQEEDASIFFDFSAEWLDSIYKMEGCAVVGYFRYLNLLDLPSPVEPAAAAVTRIGIKAPIVSVIDHYLFKRFCYEARAFMLLEAVSFYCKRFANFFGVLAKRSGRQRVQVVGGAALPVLMRCRSMNLPAIRLLQKLHRTYVKEPFCDRNHSEVLAQGRPDGGSIPQENRPNGALPAIHLSECAAGEILHVHLNPELVHYIATKLSDKISVARNDRADGGRCNVKFEKGLIRLSPTPFDAHIERYRPRWLVENDPFRKPTFNSIPSDSEEDQFGSHGPRNPLLLPEPLRFRPTTNGDSRVPEVPSSSLSSASLSTSSTPGSSVPDQAPYFLPSSLGHDVDQIRKHSRTSMETLVAPLQRMVSLTLLEAGTPVQVNNGDGLWICGYWLEGSRPLSLHWFDPARSDNAMLQHHGPIWIRDLARESRLITPISTGKVYVAVAPHVQVFPLPSGEAVEVGTLFERNGFHAPRGAIRKPMDSVL